MSWWLYIFTVNVCFGATLACLINVLYLRVIKVLNKCLGCDYAAMNTNTVWFINIFKIEVPQFTRTTELQANLLSKYYIFQLMKPALEYAQHQKTLVDVIKM